jgi:hypothetical protein
LKEFQLPTKSRFPGGWFAAGRPVGPSAKGVPNLPPILLDRAINRARHEDKWYYGANEQGARSTVTVGDKKLSFADGHPGVKGEIHSMLAASDKLFVVTLEGDVYCFGARAGQRRVYENQPRALPRPKDDRRDEAERLLQNTGIRHGHALVLGLRDGRLVEELVHQSELSIIGVDADADKVSALRRRLDDAGWYGTRVSLLVANPMLAGFPPYLASLVVSERERGPISEENRGFTEALYRSLRPYGGTACFSVPKGEREDLAGKLRGRKLPGAGVKTAGDLVLLSRQGPLAGSTDYTGGWSSLDTRVRAPLGVLWFGDSVARFKRAPPPMFVGGIMISHDKIWRNWITGKRPPYALTEPAYMDVYTGRLMSSREPALAKASLPTLDIHTPQPNQYHPPTQKDPWNPKPPVVGERVNPLTGTVEPRAIYKTYGCDGGNDYGILFTVRSGNAAFYEKQLESGVVNISGLRSGCTNSVIPACGVLNVPYFYEGCTCSYPLPVGLAMVSMPEEYEQWAVWGKCRVGPVQRVGINLGAPGDRVTRDGTLWLDYPSVGGPSPEVAVHTEPEEPDVFYRHSLWIEGGRGWPWVAASGVQGLTSLTITGLRQTTFTVRLYFAEPAPIEPAARVFDVALQGRRVLESFDVVREAGGPMISVVKELQNIESRGRLTVTFTPRKGKPLLCGVEAVAGHLEVGKLPLLFPRQVAGSGPPNSR